MPPYRTRLTGAAVFALAALPLVSLASAATGPADDSSDRARLFAPVASQHEVRLSLLRGFETRRAVTPGDLDRLIEAGRVDDAATALPRLVGPVRDVGRARLRVALARQEFSVAAPLVASIAARQDATEAERALRFAWLFAVDDAAAVDGITRGSLGHEAAPLANLLAAGRLAHDLLDYGRADSCFARVLVRTTAADPGIVRTARASALKGQGQVLIKRRDYDGALARLSESVTLEATPDALLVLAEALIRLGRTDDAITAAEWAVRMNPYHDGAHYLLGNGYARRHYTELFAAYPGAFADAGGRGAIERADSLLAAGRRGRARAAYRAVVQAHPGWADARVRLASLDFEDGRFAAARDGCFEALRACPEYGRAHATLAKALESQRFAVDVHRAAYERRFAASPAPAVPGIEQFVLNWQSLSPRHRKRVALSVAPWRQFIPVLVAGGSSYYIKPLYMLLSETPGSPHAARHAHRLRLAAVGRRARRGRLQHRHRHRGRRTHDLRSLRHGRARADPPGPRHPDARPGARHPGALPARQGARRGHA